MRIKVFVIPVLLLTDMEPDPSIQEWAANNKVRAFYGSDRLVCRLVQLAEELGVNHPPTAQHIQREVEAVTRGLVPQAKADPSPVAPIDLGDRRVIIQHVDTVKVYITPTTAAQVQPEMPATG